MSPDNAQSTEQMLRPDRRLIVCSLGRGKEIADAVAKNFPGLHQYREFIDPQLPISPASVEQLMHDVQGDQIVKDLIFQWLTDPTEGRPLKNEKEYVYGVESIDQFTKDVRRIAMLKFRALFPTLLEALKLGCPFINLDVYCRDTGQLVKASGIDVFLYQSHPGPTIERQIKQYLQVFRADYALIGTASAIFSGQIPTSSRQQIFDTLALVYANAFNLNTDTMHLPQRTNLNIYTPVHLSAWRVHGDIYDPRDMTTLPHAFGDVPGGLKLDNWKMGDTFEFWMFPDGHPYFRMPSTSTAQHGISDINGRLGSGWTSFRPTDEIVNAMTEFTAIRQGMAPPEDLMKMFEQIRQAQFSIN